MAPSRRELLRSMSVLGGASLSVTVAGCSGDAGGGPQATTEPTTDETTATPTEQPTTTAEETPGPGRVAGDPTVAAATHPDHGAILTDDEGTTLYLFENDEAGESACYGDCAEAWPPLLVEREGDLSPPAGLAGDLGTTERDDGSLQVTYDGTPLYYFVQDEQPDDAAGQGVNDVWFVVRLAEQAVAPTLRVSEHPEHGAILTDDEGMTLYLFENDEAGESACYGDCAEAWPPLLIEDLPVVPASLPGSVGTTERDDGSRQVTYDGTPLYYFVQDEQPGDAAGQGVNDVWFVVSPEGDRTTPTLSVTTHPDLGVVLTDGEGMTLYLFENDEAGESACYGDCAEAWPPLLAEDRVAVPSGLPGSVGTTERDDGSRQVTYHGAPLYYFVQDEQPGDAAGQGVNDVWFVVPPAPA